MSNKWADVDDDGILEAIQEAIEDDGRLSPGYIDIEVVNGSVTISGRVASEEELQIVDEILGDLAIENYKNKIWVDDNLGYDDDADEEDNGLKGLSFDDDDEIEEADYSGEDDTDDDKEE